MKYNRSYTIKPSYYYTLHLCETNGSDGQQLSGGTQVNLSPKIVKSKFYVKQKSDLIVYRLITDLLVYEWNERTNSRSNRFALPHLTYRKPLSVTPISYKSTIIF